MDGKIGDTRLYHYDDDVVDDEPETHKEEPSSRGSKHVGNDQNEADSSKNLLCAGVRWNIQYRYYDQNILRYFSDNLFLKITLIRRFMYVQRLIQYLYGQEEERVGQGGRDLNL